MRLALTGGGTGGHIFPNIAVIRQLKKKNPTAEIFYIGEKKSLEEKLLREEGIPFYAIHAGKWRRYLDIKNLFDAFKIPVGFCEALMHLAARKPDLLFAKGGYVSLPVALAARVLGIPVWLHESDLSPGLTTKVIARFAKKIFVSFEESKDFFPRGRVHLVGNPIREEMKKGQAERGQQLTGFSEKLPVILISGGSTGALRLNELVGKILPQLVEKAQVVHLTGQVAKHAAFAHKNYRAFPFLGSELAHIYAITSLAISRAGSGSLFELLAHRIPMLLIPLPLSASRGDQIENAKSFERQGYARVLDQDTLTPELLLKAVEALLGDEKKLHELAAAQKKADLLDAAEKIAQELSLAASSARFSSAR